MEVGERAEKEFGREMASLKEKVINLFQHVGVEFFGGTSGGDASQAVGYRRFWGPRWSGIYDRKVNELTQRDHEARKKNEGGSAGGRTPGRSSVYRWAGVGADSGFTGC